MALYDIYLLSEMTGFAIAPAMIDCLAEPFTAAFSHSDAPLAGRNQQLRLGAPIKAILDPILLLIGLAAAGLSWGIWRHKRKQRQAVLDSAWRQVLADPHYLERRHLEERRLVANGPHYGAR